MEKRTQFYLTLLLVSGLLAAVWLGLVQSIVGRPNAETSVMSFFAEKKRELATKAGSPKMVLVGGSNVFYGVSATTLSKDLHIPTVNCGLSANWGPEYTLWDARRLLQKGDIVVYLPEYPQYAYTGSPNDVMMHYVVAKDRDYLEKTSLLVKLRLFFSYDFRSLKKQLKGQSPPDESPETRLKTQDRLNEYGDLMQHPPADAKGQADRSTMCQELFGQIPSKQYDTIVRDFKNWCDQNGILFLVGWPSLYRHPGYSAAIVEENFQRIMAEYQKDQIPVLGKPRDFFYDLQYMHDSRDHLLKEGRAIRTAQMVELLKPYVEKWGKEKAETFKN